MTHFDRNVDVVQARWAFLNDDSPLTKAQAVFLDAHFGIEQRVRSDFGKFLNFNGTAGVWRRRAIDDAGGWAHDTLTEDLDLSIRARLARRTPELHRRFERTVRVAISVVRTFGTAGQVGAGRIADGSAGVCDQVWASHLSIAEKIDVTTIMLQHFGHVAISTWLISCLLHMHTSSQLTATVDALSAVVVPFAAAAVATFWSVGRYIRGHRGSSTARDVFWAFVVGAPLSLALACKILSLPIRGFDRVFYPDAQERASSAHHSKNGSQPILAASTHCPVECLATAA